MESNNNLVALVGWHEGSAGQIHAWLEHYTDYKIACFIHPEDEFPIIQKIQRSVSNFSYPEDGKFKNLPLICSKNWCEKIKEMGIKNVLITSPLPPERREQIDLAIKANLNLINAIHPSALIMEDAKIGKNVILHARSFVGYRAELADGVILNTGAQIDHHCAIGKCTTIDPGVIMAGNVTIQDECIIHTAVVIKNKITIKQKCIIGAGTVVIRDVDENQTMIGIPARPIKK